MRLGIAGLIQARWSETILDEWQRSVLRVVEGVDPDALRRTRELMKKALPDADVAGFESLIDRIELRDADDRHVVAAAVRGGAPVIANFNLNDFPSRSWRRTASKRRTRTTSCSISSTSIRERC